MSNGIQPAAGTGPTISAIAATGHTLYALGSDNTLWYSDDYTKGWTQLVNNAFTDTIFAITAGVWPGPAGNMYLFCATKVSLWRYDRDNNAWLSVPYIP